MNDLPFEVFAITEYVLPGPERIFAGLALMITFRLDTAGAFATTYSAAAEALEVRKVKSFGWSAAMTQAERETAAARATAPHRIFFIVVFAFIKLCLL